MRRTVIALTAALVLAQASAGYAQSKPGWHVSADALWATTYGADEHVGDVIASDIVITSLTGTNTLTATAITPEFDRAAGFLIEGGYHGTAWGFGARGWRVSTDAQTGATVTSSSTFTFGEVRLWGQTETPFSDNTSSSGRGTLTYNVSGDLEHLRTEGYAERLLVDGPKSTLRLRLGLAYAHSAHSQHIDLLNHGRTTSAPIGVREETDGTDAETTFDLVGPLVALAGETPLGKVQIEWLISPSALVGTADSRGQFEVTDQVFATNGTTTTVRMPWTQERRTFVPALDLQVKAGYPITRAIQAGGAILSSSLFDMPMPAGFDNHTGGWQARTGNLSFLAYSVFGKVTF